MKSMLPLPYHTIILIVMLFQISFMIIMFEDYFSNGPFINTLSIVSQISNIFTYMTTH